MVDGAKREVKKVQNAAIVGSLCVASEMLESKDDSEPKQRANAIPADRAFQQG